MADLGTLEAGTFDATNSTVDAIVGSDPVLENIAAADDADYIHTNNNNSGDEVAYLALGDMPGDFNSMGTISVRLRYLRDANSANKTWDSLRCQIFQSDRSTALTDEITLASSITTTTATNSSVTALTNPVASDKTTWDAAVVAVWFYKTKIKGGNADDFRVTAAEFTGTYTAGLDGTATPGVVAGSAAVPAVSPTGDGATTATVVAGVAAVPAVTPTGGTAGTTSPTVVAGVAAVPVPGVGVAGDVSPDVVAASAVVPAVSPTGDASTSPTVAAAVAAVPAVTVTGGTAGTASPSVVAAVSAVAVPTVTGGATSAPTVVAAVSAVAAPTTTGGTAGTATPAVVAAVVAVPAAVAAGDAAADGTTTPPVVAGVTAIPTPTTTGGTAGTTTPTVVAAVTWIGLPLVGTAPINTGTGLTVSTISAGLVVTSRQELAVA